MCGRDFGQLNFRVGSLKNPGRRFNLERINRIPLFIIDTILPIPGSWRKLCVGIENGVRNVMLLNDIPGEISRSGDSDAIVGLFLCWPLKTGGIEFGFFTH